MLEGTTENTTLVRELLAGFRDHRGLNTRRPILAVLDGAKRWPGVREVFDRPVIARC